MKKTSSATLRLVQCIAGCCCGRLCVWRLASFLKMAESGQQVFNPPENVSKIAHCSSMEQYKDMHDKSVKDPEQFWGDIAKEFHFEHPHSGKFMDYNFDVSKGEIFIKWMEGARTNICYNCLDRHVLAGKADQIAFYW